MGAFAIEWDPRLVEEAVLRALQGRAAETEFRAHRDSLYEIADPEAREAGFRALHAAWFEQLGLGQEIARALRERPAVVVNTARCLVAYAPSGADEEGELFVSKSGGAEPAQRVVVIRLRPETLTIPDHLRSLLRHELTHIDDMLDPGFGYEPWFPVPEAGPSHERLLRDRYRVLWDAFIDGRLSRLGRAPAGVRAERLNDFARAFPMLRERTEEAFERFFDRASLTHAELVAFASEPERALGRERDGPHPGERCPLCGFPTHDFEPEPERLPPAVLERMQESFPRWNPASGLCRQCADLSRVQLTSDTLGSCPARGGDP